MIYKLRCKFSESYRIKNGFGLKPIRNKKELKALISFCKEQDNSIWNSSFDGVWLQTIKMYEEAKQFDKLGEPHFKWAKLYNYIEEHCYSYWS